MRAFKRYGKEGFTLVELMIVVAIIGVLAALAIYGVRRYLASAKTSEAKNTIGAISRGGAGAYERETVASELVAEGGVSNAASYAVCDTAVPVPGAPPPGVKYQPNSAKDQDYDTGDATAGWKCLKFNMAQAQYYQYLYTKNGTPVGAAATPAGPALTGGGFEAAAVGDLDNDGTFSRFTRIGQINAATKSLAVATQVFISDEYE